MQGLLSEARSTCTAHRCPECGAHEHVTAERIVVGMNVVTSCVCRVCGHAWHIEAQAIEPA
jgi:hypothetical protein